MTSSLHLSKDRFGRWAQSGLTRGCFSAWRKIQLLKSPSSPLSVLRLSLKSPRMQLMLESLKQLISQPNAVRSSLQIGNRGYGASFRTLKDNKQGILFQRGCFSITRWHLNLLSSQTWKLHVTSQRLNKINGYAQVCSLRRTEPYRWNQSGGLGITIHHARAVAVCIKTLTSNISTEFRLQDKVTDVRMCALVHHVDRPTSGPPSVDLWCHWCI